LLTPDSAESLGNLALALDQGGEPDEAERFYRLALAIDPAIAQTHLNFGALLFRQHRLQEAEQAYRSAIELDPDLPAAWSNLGALQAASQQDEAAETSLRTALRLAPDHDSASCNLAYLLLRQGRYAEGWSCLEMRQWHADIDRRLALPRWHGEPLVRRSLLIAQEGGFGDMLQMIRYASLLKQCGASRIGVVCHAALAPLLAAQTDIDTVLPLDVVAPPQWDTWVPAFSLPYLFATTVATIPARQPYLRADPQRLVRWQRKLAEMERNEPCFRVGIVWRGNPRFENDAHRSLPTPDPLAPLADVPGVRCYSLQIETPDETAMPARFAANLASQIADFADTAAIVAGLDLVISVDTAVAHLAGALGIPCWLLLPAYLPDWRWLTDRTDSPWYPRAMRLFRQRDRGDWETVITAVVAALEAADRINSHADNNSDNNRPVVSLARPMTEATAADCPPLLGTAALMRRALAGENLVPLGLELLTRAQDNPADIHALMDFSTVLQLTGNRDNALAVQREAIRLQPLYTLPARQSGPGLHLLAVMGPGDLMANTPIECLLEDSDVTLEILYLLPDADWPDTVPDHDVMMVAVGESEAGATLLHHLIPYVDHWPRPVINLPAAILQLSRDSVSALLTDAPGVDIPATVRVTRDELQSLRQGLLTIDTLLPDGGFPVIIRPLDSHAGNDLEKLDNTAGIAAYLAQTDAAEFYLSRFVDYRGADGQFRKYRIVLIQGKPYIAHYALSTHWIIHYANAGMADSAEKRAEEAERMVSFDSDFAVRHAAALRAIHERMGLDYLIIDCADAPDGRLLIFEVDNSAVVHALDPEDLYPYKKPAMHKLFAAFRHMLEGARQSGQAAQANSSAAA
jgi:glutathione synthase/RimK-type ligase-like ATP-grasp enzyme